MMWCWSRWRRSFTKRNVQGDEAVKRAILLIVAVACLSTLVFAQGVTIEKAAASAGLGPLPTSIGGRVLHKADDSNQAFGPEVFVYQWPGTYFETSFKGTEVYFRVVQGNQILHVNVDDKLVGKLVKPDAGIYRIAGLTDG